MKSMKFAKYSGSGNDFIIIDNRDSSIKLSRKQIETLCSRRTGIGADGLLLVNKSSKYDFVMRYFNSDGGEADMCGNGGRSIALFAYNEGIVKKKHIVFKSRNAVHNAYIKPGNVVKLQLEKPYASKHMSISIREGNEEGHYINTGVPHFVVMSRNVDNINVKETGREIRQHKAFAPEGTNADFISIKNGIVHMRTYERGVEDETLACGTGAVAAGITGAMDADLRSPVKVKTRSGEMLTIHFDSNFEEVYLEGRVTPVYKGETLI